MNDKPNVLLIVCDQLRRDALGVNNPDGAGAFTPHLDRLAQEGVNFTSAYSACPSCIAARATLMTGLKHENNGFLGYHSATRWDYDTTLAGTFTNAGYQTECVGKMHVEPPRSLTGFQHVTLHDGFLHDKRRKFHDPIEYDDYLPDVRKQLGPDADITDLGIGCNGYVVHPWPWDERWHPTSWVTSKSIEFLKRRDPTKPFFLNVSYHRPHSPLDPPASFLAMYDKVTLPPPGKGDWRILESRAYGMENPIPSDAVSVDRARKAYYALITQIDYELNRLFMILENLDLFHNTIIVFLSDHGDMMFDHNRVRKSVPFEGAAGVPLMFRLPPSIAHRFQAPPSNRLAELRDVFPTLCELCSVRIPEGLDGQSLFSSSFHRDWIHGEHEADVSNHFLTNGQEKYCYFSQTGQELLFRLTDDPKELHDLSKAEPESLLLWRKRLISELDGRPEGYVKNGELVSGVQTRSVLPWAGIGKQKYLQLLSNRDQCDTN